MALDFPSSPISGQTYSYSGYTWEYNGNYWKSIAPGSSSLNCFTTFYVTNISGCSPVNILSPLNATDGLNVTGASTFTSQANFTGGLSANTFSATTYENLPSFSAVKIDGTTQFSGDTNNFINFSGINLTITSAATNTLVFSAGTGGGGGTVTSVALSAGTSGTDVNISNSAVTTSGTITINIPDASATARGLVTTGNQTFAGVKTFSSAPNLSSLGSSRILALDSSNNVQSLETGTYPSLTELSYVKGVTSAIQTQINSKGSGTVTSVVLSAGTSGTDVNISNSAVTTSGTITINIPDAGATNRGLITTGSQVISGAKSFSTAPILSTISASLILATDVSSNIQGLSTATYPSLTELTYVKGVTSAVQTQLNNKFNTSGGTVSGNLTVTGTTTSATISATTYQNLPVSAVTSGTGISASTSNGVVTVSNTQVQGITGITASSGISASTSNNVVTLTNTGVTGITAGSNISIDQSTGNVTISSTGGGSSLGSVYTTANNFNFL